MADSLAELLSDKDGKKLYSLPEFIAYFEAIYAARNRTRRRKREKVISEMYPLSRICAYLLKEGIDSKEVQVQYVDDKSVDAKIFGIKNSGPIFIEFTTAADKRRGNLAREAAGKGKLMSFTGSILEDNLEGSRQQGYDFDGRDVEGELDEEAFVRLSTLIVKSLENKLSSNWPSQDYWLCIVIDDFTNWSDSIRESIKDFLIETGLKYHKQLGSKRIQALYLTGYLRGDESWIYKYPII